MVIDFNELGPVILSIIAFVIIICLGVKGFSELSAKNRNSSDKKDNDQKKD